MNNDPLESQAKELVQTATLLSATSFVPLLDKYPFLSKCKAEDWDFFSTAAYVYAGLARLDCFYHLSKEQHKLLCSSIFLEINKWNPRGAEAVIDCKNFVYRTVKGCTELGVNVKYLPEDSLGMWLLWNLFQRWPSLEETQAARAIGIVLAAPFADWWDEKTIVMTKNKTSRAFRLGRWTRRVIQEKRLGNTMIGLRHILVLGLGVYMMEVLIMRTYFNWQYARAYNLIFLFVYLCGIYFFLPMFFCDKVGKKFWRLAAKHPYEAYLFFQNDKNWKIYKTKNEAVQFKKSTKGWSGPFRLYVPQLDQIIFIFGKHYEYLDTQETFVKSIQQRGLR